MTGMYGYRVGVDSLERLRSAAVRYARAKRDERAAWAALMDAVAAARDEGLSERRVADAAGVSRDTVRANDRRTR